MIIGERVQLRPLQDDDLALLQSWGQHRETLWGPYQRFQLDHVPTLQQAYRQSGLLSRDGGFLLIETIADEKVVGFVRYTLIPFPDADFPHPEIGFGITDVAARGQGYAGEATRLLVDYLFGGYATGRITAVTDADNGPAQRLLTRLGFVQEGTLRRATFRDGRWHDLLLFGLLRTERPS